MAPCPKHNTESQTSATSPHTKTLGKPLGMSHMCSPIGYYCSLSNAPVSTSKSADHYPCVSVITSCISFLLLPFTNYQLGGLKQCKIVIVEVRNTKWALWNLNKDVSRAVFLWGLEEESISSTFPVSRNFLHSLAHGLFLHLCNASLQSLLPFSHLFLILIFQIPLYKDLCNYIRPTWKIQDTLST